MERGAQSIVTKTILLMFILAIGLIAFFVLGGGFLGGVAINQPETDFRVISGSVIYDRESLVLSVERIQGEEEISGIQVILEDGDEKHVFVEDISLVVGETMEFNIPTTDKISDVRSISIIPLSSGETTISSCTTISSPGVYLLDTNINDHSSSCMDIEVSDVVLDCQGNTIDGTNAWQGGGAPVRPGILVGGPSNILSNITIQNCNVNEFIEGIYMAAEDSQIKDSTVTNARNFNIYFQKAHYSRIDNVVSSDSTLGFGDGISIFQTNFVNITNSDFIGNKIGVRFNNGNSASWSGAIITGSNISDNSQYGLHIQFANAMDNGLFYNNFFNNADNIEVASGATNYFNTNSQTGTNIIGGNIIYGNYWTSPSEGFSNTCNDGDSNGVCDDHLDVISGGTTSNNGLNVDEGVLTLAQGSCTPTEIPESSCSDGLDNDCDGAVDGSDSDCSGGNIIISSCTTISSPGVYLLDRNIDDHPTSCMNIMVSDVILDCQGNTIDGTNNHQGGGVPVRPGILVGSASTVLSNITIQNCNVNEFIEGIYLAAENSKVTDSKVTNARNINIFLRRAHYSQVENVAASDSTIGIGHGISIFQTNFVNITNSVASNNKKGIIFNNGNSASWSGAIVKSSNITGNSQSGLYIQFANAMDNGKFYNNFFNNTFNIDQAAGSDNYFNTSSTSGINIIGGNIIHGNYWASPSGGFSNSCIDGNNDGICDDNLDVATGLTTENTSYNIDQGVLTYISQVAPTCSDGIMNQDETDVDCGGSVCGACADGLSCSVNADCQSNDCDAGVCVTPGHICGDDVIGGDEICDGSNLNGQTCVSQGFDSGILGCLSDCTGYDASQCVISNISSSCALTSATWSLSSAQEGQQVTLTVNGDNCNGEELSFEIFEDDTFDDENIAVQPSNAIFSGDVATTSWIAEWQCDGSWFGFCLSGDPEFYFIATYFLNSSINIQSSPPDLSVSKASTVCGNGIKQGTEQCDDGNDDDSDLCTSECKLTSCGDGVVQSPNGRQHWNEQCDDGNLNNRDGCSALCQIEADPSNAVIPFGCPVDGSECEIIRHQCDDGTLSSLFDWPDLEGHPLPTDPINYSQWAGVPGWGWDVDLYNESVNLINSWYREGSAAGLTQDTRKSWDIGHSVVRLHSNQINSLPHDSGLTSPSTSCFENEYYGNTYLRNNSNWNVQSYASGPAWKMVKGLSDYYREGSIDNNGLSPNPARLSYENNFILARPGEGYYKGPKDNTLPHNDSVSFLSPHQLLSLGFSGTDAKLLQPMVFASAALDPEVKTKAMQNGLFVPLMHYLFKSNVIGDYLDPRSHVAVYTTSNTTWGVNYSEHGIVGADPYMMNMINAAHDLTHVPPVARIKISGETFSTESAFEGYYSIIPYSSFSTDINPSDPDDPYRVSSPYAYFAALRPGESLSLTIDLSESWIDDGRDIVSYYSSILRGEGTITELNPSGSLIRIDVPWMETEYEHNYRTDVLLLVNDGSYYSAPAYVSIRHIQRSEAGVNSLEFDIQDPDDSDFDGVLSGEDCNDNDPNINPFIEEICYNSIDNDCDGLVGMADEDCSSTDVFKFTVFGDVFTLIGESTNFQFETTTTASCFSVSDSRFSVSCSGLLTNTSPLNDLIYPMTLTATDLFGVNISEEFAVFITQPMDIGPNELGLYDGEEGSYNPSGIANAQTNPGEGLSSSFGLELKAATWGGPQIAFQNTPQWQTNFGDYDYLEFYIRRTQENANPLVINLYKWQEESNFLTVENYIPGGEISYNYTLIRIPIADLQTIDWNLDLVEGIRFNKDATNPRYYIDHMKLVNEIP